MHDVQLVKEMVSTRLGSTLTEISSDECIQFIVPFFILSSYVNSYIATL